MVSEGLPKVSGKVCAELPERSSGAISGLCVFLVCLRVRWALLGGSPRGSPRVF